MFYTPLLAAGYAGDPFAAIEAVVSWDQFTRTVAEANALAQPEDFDYLERLVGDYSQLRRYAPYCWKSLPSNLRRRVKTWLPRWLHCVPLT